MTDKTPENPKKPSKKPTKKNTSKNTPAFSSNWITNPVALLNLYIRLNNQTARWEGIKLNRRWPSSIVEQHIKESITRYDSVS